MCEREMPYDVLLHGQVFSDLYFNLRGYRSDLPTPDGKKLDIGEKSLSAYKREIAVLSREFQDLPASWQVLIEITERILLHPADTDAATLRTLRDAGIELVVDDFGIGASSLSSLHRFPLRMLKIDRSFVATLDQNRELIRTIAVIGHSLGLTVVAEGIETEAQRVQLIELGLTVGQGYLFAQPLTADQLGTHLRSTLKFP